MLWTTGPRFLLLKFLLKKDNLSHLIWSVLHDKTDDYIIPAKFEEIQRVRLCVRP